MKTLRVALRPEEWRRLRAWAAEQGTSAEETVTRILRGALEHRPRTGF